MPAILYSNFELIELNNTRVYSRAHAYPVRI